MDIDQDQDLSLDLDLDLDPGPDHVQSNWSLHLNKMFILSTCDIPRKQVWFWVRLGSRIPRGFRPGAVMSIRSRTGPLSRPAYRLRPRSHSSIHRDNKKYFHHVKIFPGCDCPHLADQEKERNQPSGLDKDQDHDSDMDLDLDPSQQPLLFLVVNKMFMLCISSCNQDRSGIATKI